MLELDLLHGLYPSAQRRSQKACGDTSQGGQLAQPRFQKVCGDIARNGAFWSLPMGICHPKPLESSLPYEVSQ